MRRRPMARTGSRQTNHRRWHWMRTAMAAAKRSQRVRWRRHPCRTGKGQGPPMRRVNPLVNRLVNQLSGAPSRAENPVRRSSAALSGATLPNAPGSFPYAETGKQSVGSRPRMIGQPIRRRAPVSILSCRGQGQTSLRSHRRTPLRRRSFNARGKATGSRFCRAAFVRMIRCLRE